MRPRRLFLAAGVAAFLTVAGATVVSAAGEQVPVGCTITDNVLSCPLPEQVPAETVTVTEVPGAATVTETATETATVTADPVTQTETATVTETAPPVTVTETPAPVPVFSTVTAPPVTTTVTAAPTTTPPVTTSSAAPTSVQPVPAGFPNASTTGARGTLTKQGATTLSTPGQVITNVEFTGQVTVRAANVTLRNVKINTNDFWGLLNYGSGLVLEDVTFIGGDNTQAGIGEGNGGNFTGRRLDISGSGDGIKMGAGSKLFDSFIHDLGGGPSAHNDGIEITNAVGAQVVHNTILNHNNQTSAIMISEFGSKADTNVLIQGNLLAGGGYTVYGGAPDTAKGNEVIGNTFSKRYFPRSGYWGPLAYWQSAGNTWSGNVWEDGSPVN